MKINFKGLFLMTYFAIGLLIIFPLWLISMSLFSFPKKNPTVIAQPFFKLLFKILKIKVTINNPNHIPVHFKSTLILSNHQSLVDVGIILAYINPCLFLAKSELFHIPIFGWALKKCQIIPVFRGDRKLNQNLPNLLMQKLNSGHNICVFPEGTRSATSEILPFKMGLFHILNQNPQNLLLIQIHNAHQINPHKTLQILSGEIHISIKKTIPLHDFPFESAVKLQEYIRNQYIS